MQPYIRFLAAVFVGLWALTAAAATAGDAGAGSGEVYRYFQALDTFQAQFTQQVTDGDGVLIQDASGEVWVKRPGRFRWNYLKPYVQQVVANGVELWTYDAELEQATVKPIGDVLSTTPAMLLAGSKQLADLADVEPIGRKSGQRWYRLRPKNPDENLDEVELVFDGEQLLSIRVHDNFNNTTVIEFTDVKRNQPVPDHLFSVDLPAGTDILGGS